MDPLIGSLLVEVFQAERSGVEHPEREAERLGPTPPGAALRAIAGDCARALRELRVMRRADNKRPLSHRVGESVGLALSVMRETVTDLLITRETSYRATLLGVHHGVDAIALLHTAALESDDRALADWCARTLERRRALLASAQNELAWFARNAHFAMMPARPTVIGRAARSLSALAGALSDRRIG